MPVNHFPHLPVVTNPENNACIQTVIQIGTEILSFVHCSLPTFPENFMQIRSEVFAQSC